MSTTLHLPITYLVGGLLIGCQPVAVEQPPSSALSHRDSLHQALTTLMALPEVPTHSIAYNVLSEEETDTYTISADGTLLEGEGGHQFYPDLAWSKITEVKNTYYDNIPTKNTGP